MIVRELIAKLGLEADLGDFVKADLLFSNLHKGLEKLSEKVIDFAKEMAALIPETAAEAKALDTVAQKTGLSTTAIQELSYAAERSESSAGTLIMGLTVLSRKMAAARDGSKEAAESFAGIGVKITDASGELRSSEDVLLDVAEHFHGLEDGSEKSGAAFKLFGRRGIELIPTLNAGREGLAKMREEAHTLGKVLDEKAIQAGVKMSEALEDLHHAAEGVKKQFAAALLPGVADLVKEFAEWRVENQKILRQRLVQFAQGLAGAFKVAVTIFKQFVTTAKALNAVIKAAAEHLRFFAIILGGVVLAALIANAGAIALNVSWYAALGIGAALAGVQAAAAWLAAAAPILAATAAFVLLALALDDVWGYLNGEDSLLGDLLPAWRVFIADFIKPHEGDPWWLKAIRMLAYEIDSVSTVVGYLLQQFAELPNALATLRDDFQEFWAGLGEAAQAAAKVALKSLTFGIGNYADVGSLLSAPFSSSPSVAASDAAGGRGGVTSNLQMNIQQSQGEDGEAFARRVARLVNEHHSTLLQEAQGGL